MKMKHKCKINIIIKKLSSFIKPTQNRGMKEGNEGEMSQFICKVFKSLKCTTFLYVIFFKILIMYLVRVIESKNTIKEVQTNRN